MRQTEVLFAFRVTHETDAELDVLLEKAMDSIAVATENKVECVYGDKNKSRVVSFVAPIASRRFASMEELLEESR